MEENPGNLPGGEELAALLARFHLSDNPAAHPLLRQALTHRSHALERGAAEDNERLELLGDSVVALLVTERLLELHPGESEGQLSKRRHTAVSRPCLGELALALGVGELMLLGAGEERGGGRARPSTVGSTLEALLGALYLAYPWPALRVALRESVVEPALAMSGTLDLEDFKSRLQEWCQARGLPPPEYPVLREEGPDHERVFTVEARVGGERRGEGSGTRKQLAERAAAREALRALGGEFSTSSG
ncbi:MAG: ribonuclease III [Candidatus Sumerlaeia bacterium]|nr:ribonuclease III [Candidatus Sumerlaeia bacterium]